ncbi:MAG: hypothetical protein JWP97_681 [Labilithrix sp.]|nr:hypothetical protein [Labilithrix sp.]
MTASVNLAAMKRALLALALLVGLTASGSACTKSSPMAKIDGVEKALEHDDASAIASSVEGYPACSDAPPVALLPTQPAPRDSGCFAQIATALGSKKGFFVNPPDQAAAATAAIVLMRDNRGDWLAHADNWLASIKTGKGPGPDALRLAVARKMAEAGGSVGKKLEAESDAKAAMKAIAQAIPGACPTYWLLGSGTDPATIPSEHTADHASCVHHDLQRREGMGGSYGSGTFRALEGALALWREAERALRLGVVNASPAAKGVLDTKLKTIEGWTQAIGTKKLDTNSTSEAIETMGDLHAEAGIILWKDAGAKDGGPEAADAGAPPLGLPKHR